MDIANSSEIRTSAAQRTVSNNLMKVQKFTLNFKFKCAASLTNIRDAIARAWLQMNSFPNIAYTIFSSKISKRSASFLCITKRDPA